MRSQSKVDVLSNKTLPFSGLVLLSKDASKCLIVVEIISVYFVSINNEEQ